MKYCPVSAYGMLTSYECGKNNIRRLHLMCVSDDRMWGVDDRLRRIRKRNTAKRFENYVTTAMCDVSDIRVKEKGVFRLSEIKFTANLELPKAHI